MAIANPTLGLVSRDPKTGSHTPDPDRMSTGGFGELVIGGGTAFTSAQHPNAEVIDGTGVSLSRQFRAAGVIAAGSLSPTDAGDYLVELEIQDFSCGAASGNVQFSVQYAPDPGTVVYAAFDATDAGGGGRMQAIRLALTTKESIRLSRVQHLNAGGLVRAIVTSAAGDIITITEGSLRITKVADNNPVSV